MYQSIYYDHQTYTYYLRDDKMGWSDFQYQPTYWKRVDEWQENAQPVLTGGWAAPTKKYSKDDTNLLEKDISKELVVLRELYYKLDDVVPEWHNVVHLDIEIEMGGALTPEYVKAAPMPLTSIALIDMTTKTKICFVVDKSKEIQETNQDGKLIIPCHSEKELIKHVYITNINSQNNPNYQFNFTLFNRILSSLDLFKKSKLSVETRYNSLFFMSQNSDIVVSHQMENNLNYLYLDLAWMGWPLVHNANLCKDVGYYYEGFNYDEASEKLNNIILHHNSNKDEYLKKNRLIIDNYLPTNKSLQNKYKCLIENLFS